MRHPVRLILAIVPLAVLACSKSPEVATSAPVENSMPAPAQADSPIAAAIASGQRLPGDREQDSWRKPAEILGFLGLEPGMHVIDYFAGGGYYTELMARVVGPQGRVIAYNNAAYLKYAGDTPAQRYGGNRLANVTPATSAAEELSLEPASLDAALFVQSYHDLHWRAKDGSWTLTDPAQALARLVPALKPGAVVVVVDHVAAAGSDPAVSVDALHRIDPAVVKRDFEAAGLKFEAESTALSNSGDDHTRSVFDPSIRHQSDQFVYRFRKS